VHPAWAAEPERAVSFPDFLVPQAYTGRQFVVDYFRDMIRRLVAGEDHVVRGEDALKVVEVCEAAYQSAEAGRRIRL
jgi:predicted dehydrogenase